MHSCRIISAVIALGALAACSSTNPPAGQLTPDDAGAPISDASSSSDGATAIALPFTIADEPDAPCTAFAGTPVAVHASHVPFASLGRVGTRRFAATDLAPGVSLFDADGKNPSADVTGGDLDAAAGGADLLVVSTSVTGVTTRRFAANGSALGETTGLSPDRADVVAIGRANDAALAVWSTFDHVRARALAPDGSPTGEPIDLETPAPKSSFAAAVAADPAGGFLVAWSDVAGSNSHSRIFTARIRKGAVLGLVHRLADETFDLGVVQLVARPSGFVLLAKTAGTPLVLPLDPIGRLAASAKKLVGANGTFGVATSKNEVGVLAWRDSTHVFRPLDATGKPSASWTCLGAANPGGSPAGAFDMDGTDGYAALVPGPAGESLFYRFDAKGAPL